MFMFILYAILLLIICNGYGSLLLKKESKLEKIKVIIGFCVFVGLLQIFYYPMQYFNLSSSFSLLITGIVSCYGIFLGIKKIKKDDFKFLTDYHFYVLLILFFVVMKIVPSVDATDDDFYFPFIIDNASGLINSIFPETGLLKGDIDIYHDYQGYYLLVSFFYKIQHLLFNSITDIFVAFRSTFTLLYTILFANLLTYIKELYIKKFHKYVYYVLELLSVVLIGVAHLNHIYYGSFVLFTIFIPVLMIIYNDYFNNKNRSILVLIMYEFGLLSLASSSLFLIIMLLSCYFSYEIIFKKKIDIIKYIYLFVPIIIYICFFIKIPYLMIIIPLILFVFKKIDKNFNNIMIKYGRYLIYSIPVIFILLSLLFGEAVNINLFSKSILLFNMFILALLLYFIIFKKKRINIYIWIFMFTLVLYYNPLTATCVSKLFTTPLVFYRVSFITKNPLMIICVFSFLYECFSKKIFKVCVLFLVSGLCLLYSYNLYSLMIKNEDYSYEYDYILRESKANLELGEFISSVDGSVISVVFSPRAYNVGLIAHCYRFMGGEFTDNLHKTIIENKPIDDLFLNDIKKYDYIISKVKNDNVLDEIYELVYSNKIYSVYEIK